MVSEAELNELVLTRQVSGILEIDQDNYIVNYNPTINKETCDSINLDIVKYLNKYNYNLYAQLKYNSVSVAISSAVTAYVRVEIAKLKKKVLELGGNLYYSDTDSIVTDIKLPDNKVDTKEIGKLKLVYIANQGYFISNKTYCLVLQDDYVTKENNGVIIKAKGLSSSSLNVNHFREMYKGEVIKTGVKLSAIKGYKLGSVTLLEDTLDLDPNSYTKRIKIFHNNNNSIETNNIYIY